MRFQTRSAFGVRARALLGATLMALPVCVLLCYGQPAGAQQLDSSKTPTREEPVRPGGRGRGDGQRGLLAEMTAFKTEVPSRTIDVVLSRPTHTSISVSVACYGEQLQEGYVEFRRDDAASISKTPVQQLPSGKPVLFTLDGLSPDTAYVYRVRYRRAAGGGGGSDAGEFASTAYFSFHTPRATGQAFTFTIQADSHLDQGVEPKVYEQTLANMLAAKPDFMIDLGDTFMTDKRGKDFRSALPQYDTQRYYFSRVAHSVPLFMVLGNHDGEKGTSGKAPGDIGPWSYTQRTSRFPEPIIDGEMYTGSTAMKDGVGSNYYAFEWGDAVFIVLDPFWSTTERIRGGGGGRRAGGGAERPADAPLQPIESSWSSTLGREQYDWLARTLQNTTARHRFVFIHHLVGGRGGAESRGGVESSEFFEWGGNNADGSPGFAQRRPGWPMPIHDLLVKHHVSAVFYGHDHLFVHSQRGGLTYQCVPQPGNPRGNTRTAAQYGYASGTIMGSPGHLRVSVSADKTTVEFVRTAAPGAEDPRAQDAGNRGSGGAVVHAYDLPPAGAK